MKIRLFTIPETARRLAVSRWTIYRYIEKGILQVVQLPDGRKRIAEIELERFIKQLANYTRKPPDDLDKAMASLDYYTKIGRFPR